MNERTMAAIALVTYGVGGAAGIVWRCWWQWRKTGSTGFRGISGRLGSTEWLAAFGLASAVLLSLAAPVLQLMGALSPVSFLHAAWIQLAGAALSVIGITVTVYAQIQMGESWRIGVDETETTVLVRSGVFGVVRNPIYSATFVYWLGATLLAPNPLAVVAYLLLVASIEVLVRRVEEPYLLRVHGDAYRRYGSAVGRFVPRIGLIGLRVSGSRVWPTRRVVV
jgi:protein-S-isoprenylcysteine O-methyltransferase Ste14